MDKVLTYLREGTVEMIPAFVALLVVALVLGAVNRWLAKIEVSQQRGGFRRQIVLLLLTLVGGLVVVLFLPMEPETRSSLLTLIGLVISAAIALSATTFLGNAMAGVMIRAVRNFKTGDFIRVGEHFGRVTEKELFHTEIQTEDRDLTTLPNLYLVTNPVRVVRPSGTILSATVSLGYDVSRLKIESLLVKAGNEAGLKDPFVEVRELGDFSVTYRIAGLLAEVKALVSSRSRLRACVLDALHEGGIEIVSPTFMNQRQLAPGQAFIPRPPSSLGELPESRPDEMIFDKADEAESLQELRDAWQQVNERVTELESALEAADDAERAQLEAELGRLQRSRDVMSARIEAREAELNEEPKA